MRGFVCVRLANLIIRTMKIESTEKFTKKRQAAVKRALKNVKLSDTAILNWMNCQHDIVMRNYGTHYLVSSIPGAPWQSKASNLRDALKIAMQPFNGEIHA